MAKTKQDALEAIKKKRQQQQDKAIPYPNKKKDIIQLPPISSLLPHSLYPFHMDPKYIVNKPPVKPFIPYYFHHRQFGIESCMLQMMEYEKAIAFYDY